VRARAFEQTPQTCAGERSAYTHTHTHTPGAWRNTQHSDGQPMGACKPCAPPPKKCDHSKHARTRSSALPWNFLVRITGQKRRNSFIQLPSVDLGTMTMCGPLMPRYSCRYASRLIVCSVLPRPWGVCVCGARGGGRCESKGDNTGAAPPNAC
jgi:hypothetical protein